MSSRPKQRRGELAFLLAFLGASILNLFALVGLSASILEDFTKADILVAAITTIVIGALGLSSGLILRILKSLSSKRRIFISYSSEDREPAMKLTQALKEKGALVWLDISDLPSGTNVRSEIESAIASSNTVVIFSSHQYGPNVSWEISTAKAKKIPLLVVRDENETVPTELSDERQVVVSSKANLERVADEALLAL